MTDDPTTAGPDIGRLRSLPGLSSEATEIGERAVSVRGWYQHVKKEGLLKDALILLPHLMSKQQAVWWGCLALWRYQRESTGAGDPLHDALKSAIAWLRDPGEKTRRQAEQVALVCGKGTAPGSLALAAAWSDGSMSPANLPPAPPPPDLTAKLAAACVILAVVKHEPSRLKAAYLQMISIGEEVLRESSQPASQPSQKK